MWGYSSSVLHRVASREAIMSIRNYFSSSDPVNMFGKVSGQFRLKTLFEIGMNSKFTSLKAEILLINFSSANWVKN